MTLLPAVTGSGVSDLVTARSDPATTDVFSVSELFADVGSGVLLTTDAVLTIVVPLDAALLTLSTRVNVAEAPEASEAVPPMMPPVPPTGGVVRVKAGPEFCSIETNVVPGGMMSDIVTSAAALGPALAIVIVYVTFVPATTGSGESALVIDRSADCAWARAAVADTSNTRNANVRIAGTQVCGARGIGPTPVLDLQWGVGGAREYSMRCSRNFALDHGS